jgi:hypothetical protein
MTTSSTIGRLLVTEPVVQLAILLLGVGIILSTARSLRNKLADQEDFEGRALFHARSGALARRLKSLLAGAGMVLYGIFLLLASAQVISPSSARTLLGFSLVAPLVLLISLTFRAAPNFIWRLLWGKPR